MNNLGEITVQMISATSISTPQEQLPLPPPPSSTTTTTPILIFTSLPSTTTQHQQQHEQQNTATNATTECETASPASTQSTSNNTQDYDFLNEWNWQQQQSQIHQHQEESEIDESEQQDGIPTLTVIRQPEEQHRARYLSEGSRGAIKDRSGTSNCTIQISGFYRPTRVELFAATGSGQVIPHQLYRLIPVSGKSANTTPCRKMMAHDGIECLEITLRPESSMTAVLDCVGILKICSYDAKQRKRFHGNAGSQHSAVRIAFRAYIPHEGQTNTFTVLETQTETIRCVQQLGVPEVLKMSLRTSAARGGNELFIIGRNFDRNTSVVFREYKNDGSLAWNAEATVDKQFLHQCHIVCTIPTYHNLYRGGNVSVTIRCGQKSSHPINFTYTPSVPEEFTDWRPPSSPQYNHRSDTFDDVYDYSIPTNSGNSSSIFGPTPVTSSGQEYTSVASSNKYSNEYEINRNFEYDSLKKTYNNDKSESLSPDGKRPRLQLLRYSNSSNSS
jgi:nuclear factor of activated T-cells 5